MSIIISKNPQVTVQNVGKPPGISTEHVLGHEIFVYTIWRTLKSGTVNVANNV